MDGPKTKILKTMRKAGLRDVAILFIGAGRIGNKT